MQSRHGHEDAEDAQRTGRARERRDAARRVYEQTIEGIAASGELHDLLPAWDEVRDHRRAAAEGGTEVKPIIVAAAVLALAATAALAEPLPLPKPPGPGGSCPHGYTSSGSFCVPSHGAQDAIAKPANGTCPFGWTASGSYCLRSGSTR